MLSDVINEVNWVWHCTMY